MTVAAAADRRCASLALGYLALLLLVAGRARLLPDVRARPRRVWDTITTPAAIHAFWLTIEVAAIAVPLNTAFGIVTALVLVRGRFRGKRLLDALIDLPFAISPVVDRPRADPPLRPHRLVRRLARPRRHPGDLLGARASCWPRSSCRCRSSCARSRPCCARSATSRSRRRPRSAPSRWQTFWRITLPAIRWGVAYGVVLSVARAIGEFGAVSVVSGKIARPDPDADAARREALRELRPRRRLRRVGAAGADRARHAAGDDPGQAARKEARMIAVARRHQALRRLHGARRRLARGRRTAR